MAVAYRKRKYPKYFTSKLSDFDSENSETKVYIDFAEVCKYISIEQKETLTNKSIEVGKLINFMILNPEKIGVN
ncbi:MAG: four helix bundle protein [Bacteroidota bacterium]